MNIHWSKKPLTFMVIPDANRSVVRFRVPGYLLVALPAGAALLALITVLAYGLTWTSSRENEELKQQLRGRNEQYETAVDGKNRTIEHLQNEVLDLSKQAEELQRKMEQLKKLEEEVKRLTGYDPGNAAAAALAAASGDDITPTGMGGIDLYATEEDVARLIQETRRSFTAVRESMSAMQDNLTGTKQRVLDRQLAMRITPTIWPVDSETVTSPFGMRRDPFTGKPAFHSGIDIGAKAGTPVYAAAEGTVVSAGSDSARGNNIVIDHSNGIRTRYMHLSRMDAVKGERIAKGQQIGLVGSTGRSTGPHLHYEVILNGASVNPKPYLRTARKEE